MTSLLGVLLRGKDSAGLSTREAHSFKSIYSGKVWAVRQQVCLLLQRHSQHCRPGYIPGLPVKREGIGSSNPTISVQQLKTSQTEREAAVSRQTVFCMNVHRDSSSTDPGTLLQKAASSHFSPPQNHLKLTECQFLGNENLVESL